MQLPKDLSSDEAQKTLAKLVSQLTALFLFDWLSKQLFLLVLAHLFVRLQFS